MSWKIFLLSLSTFVLISAEITTEKELLSPSIEKFVVESIKIKQSIPTKFLGHRMYQDKSGHFVDSVIENLDNDMKNRLTVLSGEIDAAATPEDKTQNKSIEMIKNSSDALNKYPRWLRPVVELYEKSKLLQKEKYNSEDNLKNFAFSVYDALLNLTDFLDEHAREMTITLENPEEYAEDLVRMMEQQNLNDFENLDCIEKIESAKLEVRNTLVLLNLMEMRGLHATIHAAWIKLLFGDAKYFNELNLKMDQMKQRNDQYYVIREKILNELKTLMQNECPWSIKKKSEFNKKNFIQ